jgi:RNase adaptor protein for sRNA GlmZ degradation
LEKDGEILTFLSHVRPLVEHHVERFLERGFMHLQVAFGCIGGQHRSVYCAEYIAKKLYKRYPVHVELIHRELGIKQTL